MNRYKYYHRILTFFKTEFDNYDSEAESSKYCFSSEQIAKKYNINILKAERILVDLKEIDCLNYSKHHGYKISQTGINKQFTKFFIYKKNENIKTNFKDLVQIVLPVVAIILSIYTIFLKIDNANIENKKDIQDLKENIENKNIKNTKQVENLKRKIEVLELKSYAKTKK